MSLSGNNSCGWHPKWVSIERATERKSDVTEERQFEKSFKRATEYWLLERTTN